jgi:hypothetical protein
MQKKTPRNAAPHCAAQRQEASFFCFSFLFWRLCCGAPRAPQKKIAPPMPGESEGPTKADRPENPASQKETPSKHAEKYTEKWATEFGRVTRTTGE